jgi:hypothetical protein
MGSAMFSSFELGLGIEEKSYEDQQRNGLDPKHCGKTTQNFTLILKLLRKMRNI